VSDVYQPAYLQDDSTDIGTYNDKNLPMWKRVGLDAPPPVERTPEGRLRVTVSQPKYQPAYLNPDQSPSFMSGTAPVARSSLPAAISDIPHEISNTFNQGLQQFNQNQPFNQDVASGPDLTAPLKAAGGIATMAASPIVGTARSLFGHPIADTVQALGGRLDNNVTGRPETPEQAYEGAKSKVDTGMLLAGVANRAPATLPAPALSPAARTAEAIGAPLPRGVASESQTVQALTAKLQSVPFAGEKITQGVQKTQTAAGETISGMAQDLGAGMGRTYADMQARPGLQGVIDQNRADINAGYNDVRSQIDRNAQFGMPRTQKAIDDVVAARKVAGWSDPEQGLEQFKNVSSGTTVEGAQRARVDARAAGNPLVPHPGYNKADYNKITTAMSADIRDMVQVAAKRVGNDPQKALSSFNKAEANFGQLADQNDRLNRIVGSQGEGAIRTLINAAKEKGGDARLLAQLKNSMPQADFERIGGALLDELGRGGNGEFSLAKFTSDWNKLSDPAKRVLFGNNHLKNIEDIVGLGQHIKGALGESNTSRTAHAVIAFDVLKTAVEGAVAVGVGALSPVSGGATAAGFIGANLLTRFLATPAKAASMAKWSNSFQLLRNLGPNASRVTQFNIATRNLANNLGIGVQSIMEGTRPYLPAAAQQQQQQQPRIK